MPSDKAAVSVSVAAAVSSVNTAFAAIHAIERRQSQLSHLSSQLTSPSITIATVRGLYGMALRELEEASIAASSPAGGLIVSVKEQDIVAASAGGSDPKTLVSSLSGPEATAMLSTAVAASTAAQQQLNVAHQKATASLDKILRELHAPVHREELLVEHLLRCQEINEPLLLLPNQPFETHRSRSLLCDILTAQNQLVHVDLSGCLLGDAFCAEELVPLAAALPALRSLDLCTNGLAAATSRELLKQLTPDDTLRFPSLRALAVLDNPGLPVETLREIPRRLLARSQAPAAQALADPEWSCDGGAPLRVLALDGFCMRAVVQVRVLRELMARATSALKFDVVGGASFSAIVAAALVLGIPLENVESSLKELATAVFAHGHLTYYGVAGVRAIRSWWSGGNYYNAASLRGELEKLFGVHANITLGAAGRLHGVKAVFYTRNEALGEIRAYRTFRVADGGVGGKCPPLASGADLENTPLIDAVMAACATPTYFAPFGSAGNPISAVSSNSKPAVDALINPTGLLVGECLRHIPADRLDVLSLGVGCRSGCDDDAVNSNALIAASVAKSYERRRQKESGNTSAAVDPRHVLDPAHEWIVALEHQLVHRSIRRVVPHYARHDLLEETSAGVTIRPDEELVSVLESALDLVDKQKV